MVAMADRVFIEHLSLRGKHGVYDWEWEKSQEFIIDISADIDLAAAAKSDDITDTADWTGMYSIAKEVIEGPSMYLIEKIAEIIAMRILEDKRIKSITVQVRKNEILAEGVPGVSITRNRL